MKFFLITILLLITSSTYVYCQEQSIRNGILWHDDTYKPIQAHGVSISEHQGVYYMLGNDMSNGNAFTGINLYSSTDLINWEFENTIIDKSTNSHLANNERITERPCLLYNAKDDRYVVWLKYQNSDYSNNKAAIFHCKTINGKYTYEKEFYPKGYDSNDCSIFTDDDGTAYYISTNKANKSLNLYKLTDDYMDASEATILFKNQNREAPVIFKKDQLYYILSSAKTGWDPNQMKYATSSSLTSGWSNWKNIGDSFTYNTQPTDVITIKGTKKTTYLYVADRWKDPTIADSKTLIMPLEVNNNDLKLNYTHEFAINLTTGQWDIYDDNSYILQDQWTIVSSSSEQTNYEASKAIDSDVSTFWHTNWENGDTYPHEIIIDLTKKETINGLMCIPRQDNNPNGNIREFQLYLSNDGEKWNYVAGGISSYVSEIYFSEQEAQYVKYVPKLEIQDNTFAAIAELRLMTNKDYYEQNLQLLYLKDESGQWKTSTLTSINPGQELEIGARPNIYGSYSWSGPNGFYANTRIAKIDKVELSHHGVYTLAYLDEIKNCHLISFTVNVNGASLIKDNKGASNLLIYPNPTSQEFNVNLEAYTQAAINIYSINGVLLSKHKAQKSLVTLNKSATLKRGIYIIEVTSTNKATVRQKLIIE